MNKKTIECIKSKISELQEWVDQDEKRIAMWVKDVSRQTAIVESIKKKIIALKEDLPKN